MLFKRIVAPCHVLHECALYVSLPVHPKKPQMKSHLNFTWNTSDAPNFIAKSSDSAKLNLQIHNSRHIAVARVWPS